MDILLSSTYSNNFWETAKLQSITACNVKCVVTLNEMVYPVVVWISGPILVTVCLPKVLCSRSND